MKKSFYKRLLRELNSQKDIPYLAKKYTLSEELLLVIYTNKVVEGTKKRFYKIKARSAKMYRKWKKGTTLMQLADKYYFPPILTGKLVLSHHGIGRKTFNSYMRDPSQIDNSRIKREIKEIRKNDIVYSPEGNDIQKERGEMGEREIAEWLADLGVEYYREDDLREMGKKKTPDFKLRTAMSYKGLDLEWIESKANFGDKKTMRENYKKQLKPYRKLFGPGMVIYWFGFVVPHQKHRDIWIANRSVMIDYGNIVVGKE